MQYSIDEFLYDGRQLRFSAWGAPALITDTLTVSLLDGNGRPLSANILHCDRPDVVTAVYGQNGHAELGFSFRLTEALPDTGLLILASKEHPDDRAEIRLSFFEKKKAYEKDCSLLSTARRYLKSENRKEFFLNDRFRLQSEKDKRYSLFYARSLPDRKTLRAMKKDSPGSTLFSIVVPVFRPRMQHLEEMIGSVLNGAYENFELCLAVGSPEDTQTVSFLKKTAGRDPRIKIKVLKENLGIAGNTDAAIDMASGDYICFLDQDDILHPAALYTYASRIAEDPKIEILYSDEDKLEDETGLHTDPFFKPDFSPAWLFCNNYICHFLAVKTSIIKKLGGLRSEYDGAQDFDFVLRASEEAAGHICHVPEILYSWRIHSLSTAQTLENKDYAIDAGKRALKDALKSRGFDSDPQPIEHLPGRYTPNIKLNGSPKVTVIIPNKDHIEDLKRCIDSLYRINRYENLEILIAENNSTEKETFEFYRALESEHGNLRVLTWSSEFNYAAINNFAVKEASGDCFLFLNNDTEVIAPDFLYSMLSWLQFEKAGAVGAKLLYADHTIQHAGVLVLTEGAAHHIYLGYGSTEPGYMGRLKVSCNVSAVTGACMLVKREAYEKSGGMDETLKVAYNDVDLCLNILDAGYEIIYDASALLYHYESRSRGYEDSPEKKKRQSEEAEILYRKHPERVDRDPYYNPNLSMKNGCYELP